MNSPLPAGEARLINPLLLAYIGDAVYELRVREFLLKSGGVKMHRLHEQAVSYVNADRQSRLYAQVEALLTTDEADILRHGRNAKSGHQPPHVSVTAYRRATGLEALIGYLHLSGEQQRLDDIFDLLFSPENEKE